GALRAFGAAWGRGGGARVGLATAGRGITALLGPPLGGALVEYATWRLIFYVTLPASLVVLYCARRGVSDEPAPASAARRFDLVVAALVADVLATLGYGLAPICAP